MRPYNVCIEYFAGRSIERLYGYSIYGSSAMIESTNCSIM